ncbi:cytochrome c [Methylococcus sp. EFPC2]|uniref:c-type cytochrome n=1 Tax=Methylococcus sp. EFPC2 TaxID=2812648 RepID=UPI001966FFEB|nr:c-type cytochrome [Methylococcus sp. EFPC2]
MSLKKSPIIIAGALLFGATAPAFAEVDPQIAEGYKLYKRERCETCHGQTGEGSAAFPNLLNSLKKLSKEDFANVVLNGRNAMPANKANPKIANGIDALYAYVKGRSDGTVPAGELK